MFVQKTNKVNHLNKCNKMKSIIITDVDSVVFGDLGRRRLHVAYPIDKGSKRSEEGALIDVAGEGGQIKAEIAKNR